MIIVPMKMMKINQKKELKQILLREEKYYYISDLLNKFGCKSHILKNILSRLGDYSVVKSDDSTNYNSYFNGDKIKFTFVGVIIIENFVIICYPKYFKEFNFNDFKQIIKVIKRFQNDEDVVYIQNDINDRDSFNMLPLILFFINDYYENGLYTNLQEIIEINTNGEILWDKTINHNQIIIQDNRPYYYELLTKKRINDNNDYFRHLHKIILTECSKDLNKANLLEIFGLTRIDLTNEVMDDFDNEDNILTRINQEIHSQFNTRKLVLLGAMKSYILNRSSSIGLENCFSLYGTSSYYDVWEKICCFVFNDLKKQLLGDIPLPIPLNQYYNEDDDLLSVIEKPRWYSFNKDGLFCKKASTLIPDLITISQDENGFDFIILDAKYYNLQLEENLELKGQPGIESITKQFLYQLAYSEFIELHGFKNVKNCFLMPTDKDQAIYKGFVDLEFLSSLNLEKIHIILLPAKKINQLFLDHQRLNNSEIEELINFKKYEEFV